MNRNEPRSRWLQKVRPQGEFRFAKSCQMKKKIAARKQGEPPPTLSPCDVNKLESILFLWCSIFQYNWTIEFLDQMPRDGRKQANQAHDLNDYEQRSEILCRPCFPIRKPNELNIFRSQDKFAKYIPCPRKSRQFIFIISVQVACNFFVFGFFCLFRIGNVMVRTHICLVFRWEVHKCLVPRKGTGINFD